jgi:transcriptional regulator with XRE-family HTH domain
MQRLRQEEGRTLQEIADKYSISRERVRQLLSKAYGSTSYVEFVPLEVISKKINRSAYAIRKFIKQERTIAYNQVGKNRILIKQQDSDKIKSFFENKKCRICGEAIPAPRTTFCSKGCANEGGKYKNRSEESKTNHKRAVMRWKSEHPEAYKFILSKATAKYHKKKSLQRYNSTSYVILRDSGVLKKGCVVKIPPQSKYTTGKLDVEFEGKIYHINSFALKKI